MKPAPPVTRARTRCGPVQSSGVLQRLQLLTCTGSDERNRHLVEPPTVRLGRGRGRCFDRLPVVVHFRHIFDANPPEPAPVVVVVMVDQHRGHIRSGDVGQHATPPGHTGFVPRPVSWTDQQLIDAVDVSTSFKQVCDRLGLWAGGGTYRTLERHMARLNLETTHLERQARRKSRRAWTDYDLAVAVRESVSFSEVGRRLGYITSGGVHRFLKRHIARLGLDTSHFVGQSWAKGRSFAGQRKRPLSEILVQNSTYMSTGRLRRRLIAEGLKPACCEMCGIATWRGKPLPLELDHINGDHTDNRIENLRIVCPNCHAVTETWCRSRYAAGVAQPAGGPSFRATQ